MANRTWAVDETNRTPQARRHKQNVIRIQINKASRIPKDAEVEEDSPPTRAHMTLWGLGIETNATVQGVPINFSPNTLAIGATGNATASAMGVF